MAASWLSHCRIQAVNDVLKIARMPEVSLQGEHCCMQARHVGGIEYISWVFLIVELD